MGTFVTLCLVRFFGPMPQRAAHKSQITLPCLGQVLHQALNHPMKAFQYSGVRRQTWVMCKTTFARCAL